MYIYIMRLFCFIVALFTTLLWVNLMFTELINAKINPYQKTQEDLDIDRKRGVLKTVCIAIMSIFWAVIIVL